MVKVRAEEYAFNSLRRNKIPTQNGKPDLQLIKNATLQSRNQNIRKEDNFQVPYKDGKIWQKIPGGTGTHSMPTVPKTPGYSGTKLSVPRNNKRGGSKGKPK